MNKVDLEILAGFEEFAVEMRAGTAKRRDNYTIEEIRISKISAASFRRKFVNGDLRKLTASIRRNGILSHIMVHRTPRTFKIADGRRRVEVCKRLGIKTIPACIIEGRNWAYNRAYDIFERGEC